MRGLFIFLCALFCVTLQAQDSYDIYLCIGQSNMAGRGYLEDSDMETSLDGIFLLNESGVPIEATHPFNQYSTITQWGKGTHYYSEAVGRARQAMKYGKLKGILWHQGCGDASARTHCYMSMLKDCLSVEKGMLWR